ncbi:hypothetical protein MXD63_11055 [Frankia sp. Cpl3]|nr:hypothetical protein [Frankia sp. Cpl3]
MSASEDDPASEIDVAVAASLLSESAAEPGNHSVQVSVGDAAAVEKLTVIGAVYGDVTVGSVDVALPPGLRYGASLVKGDGAQVQRRALLKNIALGVGNAISVNMWEALELVQRDVEEGLAQSLDSAASPQAWDAVAESHARSYAVSPPVPLMRDILIDISDLQYALGNLRSPQPRRQLVRCLGQLAALIAVLADDMGESRVSRNWMRTCRLAATEAGDRNLAAWSLAREAFFLLHYSESPRRAVELARAAAEHAGSARYAAAVMAPTVEARALAKLGDENGALAAVRRSEDVFGAVGDPESGGVFGWTEQQLWFSAGKSLTTLGMAQLAFEAQDHAIDLFPPAEVLDPALVRLDRAQALIRNGEVTDGCRLGIEILQALPADFRSPLIGSWAHDALLAIPPADRRLAVVRDFGEARRTFLG